MRQIGENLTDAECKEIIAAGDQDNDNYLNFDDFIKMMIDRKWLKKSKLLRILCYLKPWFSHNFIFIKIFINQKLNK